MSTTKLLTTIIEAIGNVLGAVGAPSEPDTNDAEEKS